MPRRLPNSVKLKASIEDKLMTEIRKKVLLYATATTSALPVLLSPWRQISDGHLSYQVRGALQSYTIPVFSLRTRWLAGGRIDSDPTLKTSLAPLRYNWQKLLRAE